MFVVCQAYREIAEQRRSKSAQYSNIQNQIVQKKKVKRRSELCLAEVVALPETTVSYKAVGRMSDANTQTQRIKHSGRRRTTRGADRAWSWRWLPPPVVLSCLPVLVSHALLRCRLLCVACLLLRA